VISVFTYIHYQLSNIGRFIGDLKMFDLYSDMHKDCYGVRPSSDRCAWFSALSDADKQLEWDRMQASIEEELRHQRKLEDDAINSCMDSGCPDIATAMRWLEDAYEMEWV
tara:strand:+ start:184 stop:513 length:330 start_codon:yes stop_codon:yes gene_type:complete